ncbi:hypothetical protein C9374_007460 [Naegleria lovaniensis]|uniref:Uncharacterized protein n=1 Tax=Naegleria lovaniensis TaxID=51637 RepID=A0AA88GLG4_NAELO|nr:uncharacterized protein C9374_007460 [Naegleria lovaniensis]KAG2379321.1 hypothetical protein C9374_007460 [Naegleria lovaniensis]
MFAGINVKEDYLGDSEENRTASSQSPLTANLREHYLSDESSPSSSPSEPLEEVAGISNITDVNENTTPSSVDINTSSFVLITANTQSPQLAPTTTLVTLSTAAIDSQHQEHSKSGSSSQEMVHSLHNLQNEDSVMVQSFLNESTKSQSTSLHPHSSVFEESAEIDTESESSLHEDQALPAAVDAREPITLIPQHEKLIDVSNNESYTTTATIETSSSVITSTTLSCVGESVQPSQQTTTIPSIHSMANTASSSILNVDMSSPTWMDVLIIPTSSHFSLFLNTGLIACVTVIVMSINEMLFHE